MFGGRFGTRDPEILEVRGAVDQHLARAVVAVEVVALAWAHLAPTKCESRRVPLAVFCVKRL